MSPLFDLDNILDNGQWVRRGLVWHWQPSSTPPTKLDAATYRPHDLIACPACHARMDEPCKTKKRTNHATRLVKRVCSCGDPVRQNEPMCPTCRAEIARAA